MENAKVFVCLASVLSALYFPVWAEQIFPAHLVGTFSRSNREPKYKIEFHPEDSPYHPVESLESIAMPDKDGQQFLCFLPKEEKAKSGRSSPQQNISSVIMETEKQVKLKTPDELLEPLGLNCLIRQEGWWSYEFCHQKWVRQVHLEGDKIVQEYFLGNYDADATAAFNQNLSDISTLKDPSTKDASQRYYSHLYNNGTICDLTNEPREIEVRFVCAEARAMITSFTELSTCNYALTVQCPTLCKHPLFQQERPVWHTIHCNKLPKEDVTPTMEDENLEVNPLRTVTDSENPTNLDSNE